MLAHAAWACAHGSQVANREGAVAPSIQKAAEDPTSQLIVAADRLLEDGIAELKQGHLIKARDSFDKAVDLYLTAPGGAYANARLGEAYRRTLEAIHLREIEALAAGDGFSEPLPEPASIDEVGEITVAEAPPSDETRRTAEEAVEEEVNDFPVELNDAVLACIDLYQGRLRDWFSEALARGGRYLPHIREVFAEEGLPQDLAYTALVESAFKAQALSRAKAKGVWQFVSATGKRYGLQQDWWVDERSDPEKATRAAAKYLKELHGLLGDWNLALAGYNAGEFKVLRGISRYGTNDYWRLRKTRAFRTETKNYVPLIHAAIVVAKAPAKYGFDIAAEAPPPFELAQVAGPVDLRVVAECLETPVDDVRALNPELRRLATPAAASYALRVPQGRAASLAECLDRVPKEKRVQFRTHVVARGQTFYTIAKKYGIRSQDLADANALSIKRSLSVGQELIIPIEPRTAAVRTAGGKPAPVVAASLQSPSSRVRVSYRIRPGDTLGGIAERYGTTVRELQSWNGLRSTRITAGRVLTIFARKM